MSNPRGKPNPVHAMLSGLNQHFWNGKFSDVTVKAGHREFKVHKVVLASHSDYFSRMLDGEWKEVKEGLIHVKDDDAAAVETMFCYMYGVDTIRDEAKNAATSLPYVEYTIYQVGDKYIVRHLKWDAERWFRQAIMESIMHTFRSMELDEELIRGIRAFYKTNEGTRELRGYLARVLRDDMPYFIDIEGVSRLLDEIVGFGADVTRALVDRSKCPVCRRVRSNPDGSANGFGFSNDPDRVCRRCNAEVRHGSTDIIRGT